MGTELNINFAIGNIKLDISEFVVAVKNLGRAGLGRATGSEQQEEITRLIREMIAETRTSFDTVVDIISPLDKIDTQRKFAAGFDDAYAEFKGHFRKKRSLPRTHCEPIKGLMAELNKKRKWMDAIPIAKRSFRQLQDICGRWATNDDQIVGDMTYLMDQLNEFLTRVARLKGKSMDTAYAEFRFGLDMFEDSFQGVERSLSDLSIVSKELGA